MTATTTPTPTDDAPQADSVYVRFARKISPRQYESAEASVSIPVPILNGITDEQLWQDVHTAMSAAKAEVLSGLGVPFTFVAETGAITEEPTEQEAAKALAEAFNAERAAEPQPERQPYNKGGGGGGNRPPQAPPDPHGPECPDCGGAVWDNREDKKNPKAPDFKCKDKGCGGVIWPPRQR